MGAGRQAVSAGVRGTAAGSYPSTPPRSSLGPASPPASATRGGSPRRPWPGPASGASPWGTPWSACGTGRPRALWGQGGERVSAGGLAAALSTITGPGTTNFHSEWVQNG